MSTMYIRVGNVDHDVFQEIRFIPLKLVQPTLCAWCPDFDPRDPRNANVSHGMCMSCAAKLTAQAVARAKK